MSESVAIVEGVVKADGSLEVSEKLALPAGRVQVTVVSMPELPKNDPFWQRMQALWDAQRTRGHVPRGLQEVEEDDAQLLQCTSIVVEVLG